MSELKAGFVGLGAMGWAMAGHLKRVGLLTGVANRSAAKTQAFAQEYGVLGAVDPGELAKHCNVIALCVSADADVLDVTRAIAANAQPGTIVVDHSTVSSKTAIEAQKIMRAASVTARRAAIRERCFIITRGLCSSPQVAATGGQAPSTPRASRPRRPYGS